MATDRAARKQKKREERARKKALRKPSVLAQEFWNLPNILTLARMAVIPLFVWFIYDADPVYSLAAAGVFAAASITAQFARFLLRGSHRAQCTVICRGQQAPREDPGQKGQEGQKGTEAE